MMASTPRAAEEDLSRLMARLRVVRLTFPLQIVVPALAFPSISKSARGFTLYPGRGGQALGLALMAASALVSALLYRPAGLLGGVLPLWLVGTEGAAMFLAGMRPTAFVKPICVSCRLLPVIKEHEAIHLSGVASEASVWRSMRTRHGVDSLSLRGDPTVCPFCPIPKRLSGN
jgi:hypothetical protein